MEHRFWGRSQFLIALLVAVMAVYVWFLFDLQVVKGDYYREQSIRKITNIETVQAARGEIFDRYGRALVTNRATYQVTLNEKQMGSAQERNDTVLALIRACREQGVEWNDSLTITFTFPFRFTVEQPYEVVTTAEDGTEKTSRTRLYQFLQTVKPKGLPLTPGQGQTANGLADPQAVVDALRTYFKVDKSVSEEDGRALVGVLYEMTLRSKDVVRTAYVFAKDVDIGFITVVKERGLSGVEIDTVTVRQYNTPYAAHILGQVGDIQNWDNYKDKGYSLSDTVGISGVEAAFESLLRGTPGTKVVELSQSGKVVSESWRIDEETGEALEPSPGDNLMLTLDIRLQEVVEKALARHVPGMTEESQKAACVVVDMTGGVLASASYPTYDLSTYFQNYNQLLEDPLQPLFNRALQGLYAPGSTFKPAVAIGGLEEEVITPREKILDTGRYLHYDRIQDQPACWIYRQYGSTHGYENVSEAIRDSCNVYFYETGIRLGITKLNEYAALLGLGQKTGLELYEEAGAVAGPETSKKYGQPWYEGEVMYAAIGQGSTQVTPIQLANYTATLVNGGFHYPTHLMKTVKSSDFSQVIEEYRPATDRELILDEENLEAVKKGMGMVVSEGTVARYFRDSPVTVGAKTGTSQVAGSSQPNAVLIAFAPYDEPEIAMAIVVEKGGSGSLVAAIAAEIIDYYFSARDVMDAPSAEGTLVR